MNGIKTNAGTPDGDDTRLNNIVDRFNAEWKAGRRPNPTDFDRLDGELRTQLIAELIDLDVKFRREAGEDPIEQEYHRQFPNDTDVVAKVFAELTLQTPADLPSGAAIDSESRFTVIRKLGTGGMGVVYLAYDATLDREVAIKLVRTDRCDSSYYALLKTEAKRCAGLQHPGIVQIYDVISDNKVPLAIVMQYICGTPLSELIDEKLQGKTEWFDRRWVLQSVAKIADSLDYLHGPQGRLLHCDIKPKNILIDEKDNPIIVDFGLSLDRKSQQFEQRSFAGTLHYMPLEQLKSLRDLLTPATEVWSLGVILYQLLSGELPFKSSREVELIKEIEESPPASLKHLPRSKDVSETIDGICRKCLARSPHERFRTTKELSKSLRVLLAIPRPPLLRRLFNSKTWMYWYAAILASVAVFGLYHQLYLRMQDPQWNFDIVGHPIWSTAVYLLSTVAIGLVTIPEILRFGARVPGTIRQVFTVTSARIGLRVSRANEARIGPMSLMAALVLWSCNWYVSQVREATNAAADGEIRVLVLEHRNSSVGKRFEIASDIDEGLERLTEENPDLNIKVIRVRSSLGRKDLGAVKEFAAVHGATFVVWGEYDDGGFFTRIKDLYAERINSTTNRLVQRQASINFDLLLDTRSKPLEIECFSAHHIGEYVYAFMNVMASEYYLPGGKPVRLRRGLETLESLADGGLKEQIMDIRMKLFMALSDIDDFEGAFAEISRLVAEDDQPMRRLSRANLLIKFDRFDEARRDVDAAEAVGADAMGILFCRAQLEEKAGNLAVTTELYERYIKEAEVDPKQRLRQSLAYNNLANVRLRLPTSTAQFSDAIRCYDEAIRLEPRNYLAWANRAVNNLAHRMKGSLFVQRDHGEVDLEDVVADCDKGIESAAFRYFRVYITKIKALTFSGEYQSAIKVCDDSMQIVAHSPTLHLLRGNAHFLTGDFHRAQLDFDAVLRLVAKSRTVGDLTQVNYFRELDRNFWDGLTLAYGDHPMCGVMLGVTCYEHGEYQKAIEFLELANEVLENGATRPAILGRSALKDDSAKRNGEIRKIIEELKGVIQADMTSKEIRKCSLGEENEAGTGDRPWWKELTPEPRFLGA